MKKWEIRKVIPEDASFLAKLMNTPEIMARLHQMPSVKADWEEAIALWLSDADEEGYIITIDGQNVGWFAVNGLLSSEKLPYIKIAVFLPDFQNRGLGKQIIRHLLAEMGKCGYAAVRLYVDEDNAIAQRCYEACEFRTVGTVCQEWPDGTACEQLEMEAVTLF